MEQSEIDEFVSNIDNAYEAKAIMEAIAEKYEVPALIPDDLIIYDAYNELKSEFEELVAEYPRLYSWIEYSIEQSSETWRHPEKALMTSFKEMVREEVRKELEGEQRSAERMRNKKKK